VRDAVLETDTTTMKRGGVTVAIQAVRRHQNRRLAVLSAADDRLRFLQRHDPSRAARGKRGGRVRRNARVARAKLATISSDGRKAGMLTNPNFWGGATLSSLSTGARLAADGLGDRCSRPRPEDGASKAKIGQDRREGAA
jgi:hypothetical protein